MGIRADLVQALHHGKRFGYVNRNVAQVVELPPQAARLATIEGIEGLSLGRLADATGIAKSSVRAVRLQGGAPAGDHQRGTRQLHH